MKTITIYLPKEGKDVYKRQVHAYTGDQMTLDGPQRKGDLRRARAAAIDVYKRQDIDGEPVFFERLHQLLIGLRPVMLGQIVSRFIIILLGDIHQLIGMIH